MHVTPVAEQRLADLLAGEKQGLRLYLDRFLRRLGEGAELDYEEWRGKFWLRHPELDR